MSDDLVKRLLEPIIDTFFGPVIEPIKKEAANRIEQLEAALREIVMDADFNCAGNPFSIHGEYFRVARAALGEKKDV